MKGWNILYHSVDLNMGCPVFVQGRKRRKALAWAVALIRKKGIRGRLNLSYVFKKTRTPRSRRGWNSKPRRVKRHPCRLG
jgi:hypothetical protein